VLSKPVQAPDPEPLVSAVNGCTLACAMLPSREDCNEDCEAARAAAARAAHLLERTDASDVHWVVEYWLAASRPGELRLAPAGTYPSGRVPVAFRAAWWRAVEQAAREQAEQLEARLT
jgi:hypothetical protein